MSTLLGEVYGAAIIAEASRLIYCGYPQALYLHFGYVDPVSDDIS
jgi:hypothetical protein